MRGEERAWTSRRVFSPGRSGDCAGAVEGLFKEEQGCIRVSERPLAACGGFVWVGVVARAGAGQKRSGQTSRWTGVEGEEEESRELVGCRGG